MFLKSLSAVWSSFIKDEYVAFLEILRLRYKKGFDGYLQEAVRFISVALRGNQV
jgi:hypothetical protein